MINNTYKIMSLFDKYLKNENITSYYYDKTHYSSEYICFSINNVI